MRKIPCFKDMILLQSGAPSNDLFSALSAAHVGDCSLEAIMRVSMFFKLAMNKEEYMSRVQEGEMPLGEFRNALKSCCYPSLKFSPIMLQAAANVIRKEIVAGFRGEEASLTFTPSQTLRRLSSYQYDQLHLYFHEKQDIACSSSEALSWQYPSQYEVFFASPKRLFDMPSSLLLQLPPLHWRPEDEGEMNQGEEQLLESQPTEAPTEEQNVQVTPEEYTYTTAG